MRRRDFISMFGSAAAIWPLAARAQQVLPVIGFMSSRAPEDSEHLVAAFRRRLREGGFVEGQNVAIEFRWARGDYDRLPAMAADLVSRGVSVLTTAGGDPPALAAERVTSTIPIVFGLGGDPVSAGLVQSFNRPGGNATGVRARSISASSWPMRVMMRNSNLHSRPSSPRASLRCWSQLSRALP